MLDECRMVRKDIMNFYFQKVEPVIYNPETYTKEKLYKSSLLLCREFFIKNNLSVPEITEKQNQFKPNSTAHYDKYKQVIHINLNKCKKPEFEFSQNYNFPGWRFDSTILGVLGKQSGFHLENILNEPSQGRIWTSINESPIFKKNDYCLNDFSECTRIFITNPGLLRRGRPQKWLFFTKYLNLRPVFDLNWDIILQYSDSNSIESVKRWFLT